MTLPGTAATGSVSAGIDINELSGPGTFSATSVTVENAGGSSIAIATVDADLDFGPTTVELSVNNSQGLSFETTSLATSTITFADLDLTSSGSPTGTVAINLSGTTGGTIQVGDDDVGGEDATIDGVDEGVRRSGTTNTDFTFGDGESAVDVGSSITATLGQLTGSAAGGGSYDLDDVS